MKKLLFFAAAAAVMFSSCSKDATEVAPAVTKGKVVMTASMSVGEGTRTVLNEEGVYEWTAGDMAGVTAAGVKKPVMLNTPNGGASAQFVDAAGQIDYVGTEDLLFFYPYQAEVTTTEADGKIETIDMTIPETQIYREGSFSTMTAPAIAAVAEFDAENAANNEITFLPVASYVKVPVRGIGTLEKLTMRIYPPLGPGFTLSGTNSVDVEERALEISTGSDMVTIDFGKGAKGLTLYEGKTVNVMFVVPAHLNVVGAHFTFEAKMAGSMTSSWAAFDGPTADAAPAVVDAYKKVQPNGIIKGKEIILGADNYYVVEDCRDFVTWAYQVYNGWADVKPAYIIADLDFEAYANGGADNEKVTACTADEWTAVQWYRTNDYAIYKIWDNVNASPNAYAIDSDIDGEGTAATISNLKVIGNSIFGHNGTVENIVLKDVELNATNNSDVKFFTATVDTGAVEVENVTIDGGTIIGSEATADNSFVTGYMYATLANNDGYPAVTNYPTVGSVEIQYADEFRLTENANITDYVVDGVVKFNTIYSKEATGTILSVNDDAVENVGVLFDNCDWTSAGYEPFSVVIGETSYWTGKSYALNADNLFTAEELAYAVENRDNVQLMGLDIDLMGTSTYVKGNETLYAQNWEKVCNQETNVTNIVVDGYYDVKVGSVAVDSRARVISNVNIETELQKVGNEYVAVESDTNNNYSLFGQSAYLNQVKVKDLSISLTKNTKVARVAGLAYTGTATDVEIDGLKVRTEIETIGQNAIGAIIAALPSTNSNTLKNCVVKNANMLSFKKDGETAYSALARGLFGYLTIDQSQTHVFEGCSFDVNSPAKQIVGQAKVKVPNSASSQVNPILKFTNCSANSLIKKLTWLDSSDQTVTTGNYPVQVWKNGVESYVNIGTTTIK